MRVEYKEFVAAAVQASDNQFCPREFRVTLLELVDLLGIIVQKIEALESATGKK